MLFHHARASRHGVRVAFKAERGASRVDDEALGRERPRSRTCRRLDAMEWRTRIDVGRRRRAMVYGCGGHRATPARGPRVAVRRGSAVRSTPTAGSPGAGDGSSADEDGDANNQPIASTGATEGEATGAAAPRQEPGDGPTETVAPLTPVNVPPVVADVTVTCAIGANGGPGRRRCRRSRCRTDAACLRRSRQDTLPADPACVRLGSVAGSGKPCSVVSTAPVQRAPDPHWRLRRREDNGIPPHHGAVARRWPSRAHSRISMVTSTRSDRLSACIAFEYAANSVFVNPFHLDPKYNLIPLRLRDQFIEAWKRRYYSMGIQQYNYLVELIDDAFATKGITSILGLGHRRSTLAT